MTEPAAPTFLDVPVLLERSMPQPRMPWFWFVLGVSMSFMVISGFFGACNQRLVLTMLPGTGESSVMMGASAVISMLLFMSLPLWIRSGVRKNRVEQQAIASLGELAQLRHWPQAAQAIEQVLSQPMRSHRNRAEALVYLALVLARYHRFEEAISVHDYVLDHDLVDLGTAYGLKIARAMSMLREDHLFDADRAISELRRISPPESAAFALIEIYRHVKTGHPEDAVLVFESSITALRDQLGHRLADAYALAARAYDLLERPTEAADVYRRATLLAPLAELCRRYPEVQKLVGRYESAPAPPEMV